MSTRYYNDFISAYIKYTEDTEPPRSYHTWTAISTIAAALQRRVHIEWGYETIYPNMYIVLVGPSGKCRKGTAMNIAKDLLRDLSCVSLNSESVTREALIRKMNDSITSYTNPITRDIKFHCALTTISPELSVFLGQNDIKFLADLTDWYDSGDTWTYETKNSGTDKIQGLCFNLLGATAPDWFSSILPQEAIGGGFTSRIIFIVEENKGKTVAKPIITQEHKDMRKRLFNDLEQITTITGQYEFDTSGETHYVEWYEREEENIRSGHMPIADGRFAGYCDRRATHVRKLCMILSASQGNEMLITKAEVMRAITLLESIEQRMPKAFSGLGRAQYSDITEKVLSFIHAKKHVTRTELMRRFYRDLDAATLKVVEDVMQYMKVVEIRHSLETREVTYHSITD